MNILLSILLIIAILIAFLLFLALIIKKEYSIERDITIDKPISQVFDYIKLVKNQEQYNVWVMRDPNVKIDYRGTDGTVGFTTNWQGNKQAGKGEQEIKSIVENKSIALELRFEEPFKNVGQAYLITTPVGENQTNVNWKMMGRNKFPMNLMNMIIDGLLGKDINQSLVNLKEILERN